MPRFDWDPRKAGTNLAKHGVSFEDARLAWDDPRLVVYPDAVIDHEQRWHAIGRVGLVTMLLVVHIYPDPADDDRIRIISARKATPRERRGYEQTTP